MLLLLTRRHGILDIASLLDECLDVPHFFDFAVGFRLLADFADANDVCIVSYEDLVVSPQSVLERLFHHLNIASYQYREIDQNALANQRGQLGDQKIFHSNSIHSDLVGAFRSILSAVELQAIVRGLGPELLNRLGYEEEYNHVVRNLEAQSRRDPKQRTREHYTS